MHSIKNICVIGGGNIGTYVAVYAKLKGYKVSLYVSDESRFAKTLEAENEDDGKLYSAEIDCITSDIKKATENIDVIFISYPAFMFGDLNEKLLPYVDEKTVLCVLPGTGGAEYAFSECIKKGVKFFGLQRVPLVARLVEYGRKVHISGKRPLLQLGAINVSYGTEQIFSDFLKDVFETDCAILPNYLCVTLTPSNPILHTSRLYSMFKNYKEGVFYERNFLFYEEWNDDSSALLLQCDCELQALCSVISKLELSSVMSLKKHYESENEVQLTKKIRSIKSFKGLGSPMKQTEKGWIPDFSSRYFTADFPFGLKILIDIARLFNVKTPAMNLIWEWFCKTCPDLIKKSFELNIDVKDFLDLYKTTLEA